MKPTNREVTVNYDGIEFVVKGVYQPRVSYGYDDPITYESFDIKGVYIHNTNILSVMDNEVLNKIEGIAIDLIRDED